MTESDNKQAESRKISNQKYYNKIKQDKQDKQDIKQDIQENKISNNNNIECTIENPEIILNVDSEDWSTWLYDTTIGSIKMIAQTFIQTGATILVPAILMWIMPRQQSTQTPLITSSGSVLKPQERDTQQPQTLLNLSQLM